MKNCIYCWVFIIIIIIIETEWNNMKKSRPHMNMKMTLAQWWWKLTLKKIRKAPSKWECNIIIKRTAYQRQFFLLLQFTTNVQLVVKILNDFNHIRTFSLLHHMSILKVFSSTTQKIYISLFQLHCTQLLKVISFEKWRRRSNEDKNYQLQLSALLRLFFFSLNIEHEVERKQRKDTKSRKSNAI